MSVGREVLARVNGVPVEKVSCKHCQFHAVILNNWFRCVRWNTNCGAKDFCSFWVKEVSE